MFDLQKKMNTLDDGLGGMQTRLTGVRDKVRGVRSDLKDLKAEIEELKGPVFRLQKPIESVSKPMRSVNDKLTFILISVVAAAVAIAFGTPLIAILLFRHHPSMVIGSHQSGATAREHEVANF
jgi:hypothetical protein